MGFFEKDMEEMLDVYLLESDQLLEQADTILLQAEQEKKFSKENINGIFRVMHTIKSSSAMMGLSEISTLAHRLEDLFDVFREEPERLNGNEQATFDLIFEATDFMKSEMGKMRAEDYQQQNTGRFFERIDSLVAQVRENKKITVKVTFKENCRMENIRAYMVARQVKEYCSSLETFPENVENDGGTAEYIRQQGFFITFEAEEPDEVIRKISEALFVDSCTRVEHVPEEKKETVEAEIETPANFGGEDRRNEEKQQEQARKPTVKEENGAHSEKDFINVRVERLDELQNLTGELIIAASALDSSYGGDAKENEGKKRQVERLLNELEELVISIRMVPFSNIAPRLNRIVRDICRKENKEVNFTVTGQEVEVDKKIADNILEPLIHLIRNAVDHGIEMPQEREANGKNAVGNVTLAFENRGGEIVVSVSDDGRGIDLERVKGKAREKQLFLRPEEEYTDSELLEFCLLPGFSTRNSANEFSGRGVGLDVVRQMVEAFGGHLHLESRKGEGSRFLLYLPLTLTIVDCIRFEVGNCCFAVPAHQVIQFLSHQTAGDELVNQGGREYWICDGRYIPVISLKECYHVKGENKNDGDVIAYVKGSTREACILADNVVDQGSLVEKPLPAILGPRFRQYTGISGCSLLGNGEVCMQIDVEDLIRMAEEVMGHDGV